jgi:predicted alpha/beta hydrolase family esterase
MVIVQSKRQDGGGQSRRVLMQPGWQNSGSEHWQTLWERRLGESATRVEQRDWAHPDKVEWVATLKAYVLADERPAIIIAHSLGCIATAMLLADDGLADAGPARSRVAGAVLVAPADTERPDVDPVLADFTPIPKGALGIPTLVIASSNDSYCAVERARSFANVWKADLHILDQAGHINTEAGFGAWPEGWELVEGWIARRIVREHEEERTIE